MICFQAFEYCRKKGSVEERLVAGLEYGHLLHLLTVVLLSPLLSGRSC